MSQTKAQSAFESMMNIVVGFTINIMANFAIFPVFGWEISLGQNLLMGCFFTVISFIRSYCLRRFYNWKHRGVESVEEVLSCPKCLIGKKNMQSSYARDRANAAASRG